VTPNGPKTAVSVTCRVLFGAYRGFAKQFLSYLPQFKREAVRLVRSSPDKTVTQIAKELGVLRTSHYVAG
jgi:hypothetical protein